MLFWKSRKLLRFARQLFSPKEEERKQAADFLRETSLRTASEARRILGLLRETASPYRPEWDEAYETLLGLFWQASPPAMIEFIQAGPPVLNSLAQGAAPNSGAWGRALAMLSGMGTPESVGNWVERFLNDKRAGGYYWACQALLEEPQQPEVLFPALLAAADCPERGTLILAIANALLAKGRMARHPFEGRLDVLEGLMRRAAARPDDTGAQADAREALTALGWIRLPRSKELLRDALAATVVSVRMDAARALSRQGDRSGLEALVAAYRSPLTRKWAEEYLKELRREDLLDPGPLDGDTEAIAKFASWLTHPNELARPPDAIDVVDKRVLYWPPMEKEIPLWVLRYRVRDSLGEDHTGVGLVGSSTWCFFADDLELHPPEDVYARHCWRELEPPAPPPPAPSHLLILRLYFAYPPCGCTI
jgi:hypothetical protein